MWFCSTILQIEKKKNSIAFFCRVVSGVWRMCGELASVFFLLRVNYLQFPQIVRQKKNKCRCVSILHSVLRRVLCWCWGSRNSVIINFDHRRSSEKTIITIPARFVCSNDFIIITTCEYIIIVRMLIHFAHHSSANSPYDVVWFYGTIRALCCVVRCVVREGNITICPLWLWPCAGRARAESSAV